MCVHGKARPVCFTPKSPLDASAGGLVFYDVVEPKIVAQSSVLSCIAEADGEARLPEAVTVSDFRLWLTAKMWPRNSQQLKGIALSDICTVLKVADAVDDKGIDSWIVFAADHLISQLPRASSWRHQNEDHHEQDSARRAAPYEIQADVEVLASLPAHVQTWVYAALGDFVPPDDDTGSYLYLLLDQLQQCHDRSICSRVLATAISPDRQLCIHPNSVPSHFLDTLVTLPAAPPQLLSLDITDAEGIMKRKSYSPLQTAQRLARMISHHTALSSLTLGQPCTSPELFEVLAPAMAALRSLRSLRLGAANRCVYVTDPSLPHLCSALTGMPRLQCLEVFVEFTRAKRQRDADAAAPPQHTLASTLSPATALTRLHVHVCAHSSACMDGALIASSVIQMPHLVALGLHVDTRQQAAALLGHLVAPLSHLTLGTGNHLDPKEEVAEIEELVESLARFPQLRQLTAARNWEGGDLGKWVVQALIVALTATSPALMVLQQLHTLDLGAGDLPLDALKAIAPGLRVSVPALQRLSMKLHPSRGDSATGQQWEGIADHISRLPLQFISLSVAIYNAGLSLLDLQRCSCLSALCIDDPELDFLDQEELSALARMPLLRRLHLEIGSVERKALAALVPALGALPHLTSLVLTMQHPAALDSAFAACPPGSWSSLRRLGVDVPWASARESNALVRTVCGMPALQRLAVQDAEGDDCDDDEFDDFIQELRQIADGAHVEFAYESEWPQLWRD